MKKSDDYIVNRLLWKAGKYELPTKSSFYFTGLSPELQQYLSAQIEGSNSGIPVLFFTRPSQEWTLLCTRQVIGHNTRHLTALYLRDIKQITTTVFDQLPAGQPFRSSTMKKKTEWDEIKVIDQLDNAHLFYADRGSDLFALWNILLMASGLNTR